MLLMPMRLHTSMFVMRCSHRSYKIRHKHLGIQMPQYSRSMAHVGVKRHLCVLRKYSGKYIVRVRQIKKNNLTVEYNKLLL